MVSYQNGRYDLLPNAVRRSTLRELPEEAVTSLVQILAAVTLSGAIITISPAGLIEGDVAADFLALDKAIFDPSRNDIIAGSFLLALSLIPAIALSANVLATLRGDDVFIENPDSPGMPEINLAAFMIVPITIGALFISTDHLTGTNELLESTCL